MALGARSSLRTWPVSNCMPTQSEPTTAIFSAQYAPSQRWPKKPSTSKTRYSSPGNSHCKAALIRFDLTEHARLAEHAFSTVTEHALYLDGACQVWTNRCANATGPINDGGDRCQGLGVAHETRVSPLRRPPVSIGG